MKVSGTDHIVLTTEHYDECIKFYTKLLGFRKEERNGRTSLFFGNEKINIHRRPAEFQPAAEFPLAGSLDLCFRAEGDPDETLRELTLKGAKIVAGVVTRSGALGDIRSIYLRDPDGNLVELGFYTNLR